MTLIEAVVRHLGSDLSRVEQGKNSAPDKDKHSKTAEYAPGPERAF